MGSQRFVLPPQRGFLIGGKQYTFVFVELIYLLNLYRWPDEKT